MPFSVRTPVPNRSKPWSSEEDKTLCDMRASGRDWAEIGKVLGRTQSSCETRHANLRKRLAPSHE